MSHQESQSQLQLQPTFTSIPLSIDNHEPSTHNSIDIITSLLNPSECATIIEKHQNLTPSNITPETVRTREVFEDAELAERVWERLKGFYGNITGGKGTVIDEDGEVWKAKGFNEVWRLCFYEEGTLFFPFLFNAL